MPRFKKCLSDNSMGKQLVAWKEYYSDYWLKELQESMDMCTGRRSIIELTLKRCETSFKQSINLMIVRLFVLLIFQRSNS